MLLILKKNAFLNTLSLCNIKFTFGNPFFPTVSKGTASLYSFMLSFQRDNEFKLQTFS